MLLHHQAKAVILSVGVASTLLVIGLSQMPVAETDFRTFYDSAAQWRAGAPLYGTSHEPNLNPPTLAIVLAPLTWMSLPVAFALWTALGIVCVSAVVARVWSMLVREPSHAIWLAAGATVAAPTLPVWQEGQVTWVLLWLLTRAREAERPWRAGVWLGIGIALKPPLALVALILPRRIWWRAGAVSVSLTLTAILVTGWSAWRAWLDQAAIVTWLGSPLSLSLWGMAARMETFWIDGLPLSGLRPTSVIVVVSGAVLLYRSAVRQRGDRRWTLAVLWMLLVSPAGWIYYLPLASVSAIRSWPRSRLAWAALGLWLLPMPALGVLARSPIGVVVGGSLGFLGAVLAWIAWSDRTTPVPSTSAAPGSALRR